MAKVEIIPGTLDMLILRVLNGGSTHGWGIAQRIHVLSSEVLKVEEGSLYPSLYRMEQKGWIDSEWGQSENNRRAKFYSLTKAGKKQLEAEKENWDQLVGAIKQVMSSA
ncbi:PadR family transcriptional regulator [Nibricoccus aquaticus]|uniref:PadR family transcriptional regulator n=1 Tax=Nibricoccus aquaticus TaxID=2576891 RepID=A0A290QEP0_9BACT|nr:PadR family transcriptional regulator [Nibricoccus aquaticus]ATC63798.1 PadR family transcriptional regulator [Nibricoccus aquaticus]